MLYVQAVNGLFYAQSMIVGREWYISIKEDEVIIVTRRYGSSTNKSNKKRIRSILNQIELKAEIGDMEKEALPFPPDWKGMVAAFETVIEIKSPIPVPDLVNLEVKSIDPDHEFIVFEHDFSREELLDPGPALRKFLSGSPLKDYIKGLGNYKYPERLINKLPEIVTLHKGRKYDPNESERIKVG